MRKLGEKHQGPLNSTKQLFLSSHFFFLRWSNYRKFLFLFLVPEKSYPAVRFTKPSRFRAHATIKLVSAECTVW
jgi:hypothetical protein